MYRVQVYGVLQPDGECGHHLIGVIARPVEPAVHHLLHPPQRAEHRRRRQRRGGHRHRGGKRQYLYGQQDQTRIQPDQKVGDDRIGVRPADDPVDLIQPLLQDRDGGGHLEAQERQVVQDGRPHRSGNVTAEHVTNAGHRPGRGRSRVKGVPPAAAAPDRGEVTMGG